MYGTHTNTSKAYNEALPNTIRHKISSPLYCFFTSCSTAAISLVKSFTNFKVLHTIYGKKLKTRESFSFASVFFSWILDTHPDSDPHHITPLKKGSLNACLLWWLSKSKGTGLRSRFLHFQKKKKSIFASQQRDSHCLSGKETNT